MKEYIEREALKPFAFCGGEAKLTEDNNEYYWINYSLCRVGTDVYETKEEVIELWNRRV